MLEEYFVLIVAIAALVYSFSIRKLQYKFGNQKQMEEIQKKTKALNQEYKEAAEQKNQARMETIMKKQQEVFPEMGKLMMGQFKTMGIVMVIFLSLMWVINTTDPFKADDIHIPLVDDGSECDSIANDNLYSGCYQLTTTNYGAWVITASAYDEGILGDSEFAKNTTSFIYMEGRDEIIPHENTGNPMPVYLDREEYELGDTVQITAEAPENRKPKRMEAVLNSGTWFHVDLPIAIPIFNVTRIQQPYWWFILVTFLGSLIITPIYKKLQQKGEKNAETKT